MKVISTYKKLLLLNKFACIGFFLASIIFFTTLSLRSVNDLVKFGLFFYLFAAGLHHFWQQGRLKHTYLQFVQSGYNPYRWVKYMTTCSMMTLLVAYVIGINNLLVMIVIVVATIAMNYQGYVIEKKYDIVNSPPYQYLIIGSILGIIPFVFLFNHLILNQADFIEIVLVITLLSLYMAFPFNVYQYLIDQRESFITYEAVFICLSFITKLIISLLIVFIV